MEMNTLLMTVEYVKSKFQDVFINMENVSHVSLLLRKLPMELVSLKAVFNILSMDVLNVTLLTLKIENPAF